MAFKTSSNLGREVDGRREGPLGPTFRDLRLDIEETLNLPGQGPARSFVRLTRARGSRPPGATR